MSSSSTVPNPPVVIPGGGSRNNIIISPSQRLNPILEHVRNVGKEFGDIVADYQVGRTTGVLFLSLKYHRLHPEYIHQRIQRLGHSYTLRILLLMCDVSEHQDPIRELTKVCLINNITVIVAWSPEEAGAYLSTFKQFEHRPPDMIKERVDNDYTSILRTALTSISKVNKTDVETLRTSFGSFAAISHATSEQLSALPGFGQVKVKRIKDAFDRPFRNNATSTLRELTQPSSAPAASSSKQKGKGKEREPSPSRVRDPSPVWDIELDLDPTPSPPGQVLQVKAKETGNNMRSPSPGWDIEPDIDLPPDTGKRARSASPAWDLELDLNPSDEDVPPTKRLKAPSEGHGPSFGPSTLL